VTGVTSYGEDSHKSQLHTASFALLMLQ